MSALVTSHGTRDSDLPETEAFWRQGEGNFTVSKYYLTDEQGGSSGRGSAQPQAFINLLAPASISGLGYSFAAG